MNVRARSPLKTQFSSHFLSMLIHYFTTCKAASSQNYDSTQPTISFRSEAGDIAPGKKKPEHQWRFKSTSKPPGRKHKGMICRYYAVQLNYNDVTDYFSCTGHASPEKGQKV